MFVLPAWYWDRFWEGLRRHSGLEVEQIDRSRVVRDLLGLKGPGGHEVLETGVGKCLAGRPKGRRSHGQLSIRLEGRMGYPSHMPELEEYASTLAVHGIGHILPALNLFGTVDPRGCGVADPCR